MTDDWGHPYHIGLGYNHKEDGTVFLYNISRDRTRYIPKYLFNVSKNQLCLSPGQELAYIDFLKNSKGEDFKFDFYSPYQLENFEFYHRGESYEKDGPWLPEFRASFKSGDECFYSISSRYNVVK